ncbi:hypothetical protein [Phaeobacter phage MD18]|nr:hypothetical protein [Phaeobacter phage MD18]
MSRLFFTGCTHFGHANIIKLANRPFADIKQMDEALTDYWNETVRPSDRVYHLGDFAWWKKDPMPYLDRLNGEIILLRGNHDPDNWGEVYCEIKRYKRLWCMMHYPIEEWNGWFRGAAHVHCHTHKKQLVSAERRFNVGVDATAFRPINIDELEALI